MSDSEQHNFYLNKKQLFVPSRCRRAIDSVSQQPFTEINQIIGESSKVEDKCFVFKPETVSSGCSDRVLENLYVETQPALPADL